MAGLLAKGLLVSSNPKQRDWLPWSRASKARLRRQVDDVVFEDRQDEEKKTEDHY